MSRNCSDDNNSDGFGGIGPDGNKSKSPITCRRIDSSSVDREMISVDRPVMLSTVKVRCMTGFLMSASMSSTRREICANAKAMFAAVVDLPSCGAALDTTMIFRRAVPNENTAFVRIDL